MKGRKNGCPVNIKNWLVYILDVATNEWVRIYGLSSLTNSVDSDTEDGSADTDLWEEPYVTKRNASVSLEGKPVVEESTGEIDAGQDLLNSYAEVGGCDGDATLKFIDPYGHSWIADYIVNSHESSADDSENTESWELSQVGEAQAVAYVQVTSIALKDGDTTVTTLSFAVGDAAKLISVDFTPETSSNKRFRVSNKNRKVATVSNITENGFTVTPVAAGTTNITVTSVNGAKTATVAVTVTAS